MNMTILKKVIIVAGLATLCLGCTTTFKASTYREPVQRAIEKQTHYVKTMATPNFSAAATISKFNNMVPNESMLPAIDASLKSALQDNSPFTNFSIVAGDGSQELVDGDLYILVYLDRLTSYFGNNHSWYDIDSSFVVADGSGTVYLARKYTIVAESTWGTLQSAQDLAVAKLLETFYSEITELDFTVPVDYSSPEEMKTIIADRL